MSNAKETAAEIVEQSRCLDCQCSICRPSLIFAITEALHAAEDAQRPDVEEVLRKAEAWLDRWDAGPSLTPPMHNSLTAVGLLRDLVSALEERSRR